MLHLRNVENNYAELFEDDTPLTGDSTTGNLVFTGTEDDPDTLSNLREMGFENAENVSVTVRGWHHGRYRATRSRRAREILTELMPTLLGALSKTTNPDMAFRAFDEFLKGLPAGVQLFSLFTAHPELLELLAQIAGTAPRMAKYIGRNASVLDFVLMSGFHEQLPDADAMLTELDARLSREDMVEDWLDAARRWANSSTDGRAASGCSCVTQAAAAALMAALAACDGMGTSARKSSMRCTCMGGMVKGVRLRATCCTAWCSVSQSVPSARAKGAFSVACQP